MSTSIKILKILTTTAIGITGVGLAGCDGAEQNLSAPEQGDALMISDLHFPDRSLAECVTNTANQASITRVSELTSLSCGTGDGKQVQATADSYDTDQTTGAFNERNHRIINLKGIEQLSALEHLDVSFNWVKQFDPAVLPNLKALNLSANIVTELDVSQNAQLETLTVDFNPLQTVTLGAAGLTTLSARGGLPDAHYFNDVIERHTDYPFLGDITPQGFSGSLTLENTEGLANVESFSLPHRALTEFDVGLVPAIVSLDLSHNSLTELVIADLENIEHLELQNNSIHTLSGNQYQRLKYVDLSYNRVTTVTDADFLLDHVSEYLNLSHNGLTEYSGCGVGGVDTLDLSHNQLSELWPDCYYLAKVVKLNDNQLTDFKSHGRQGASLESIDLSNNQFKRVEIHTLMEFINLSENQIDELVLPVNIEEFERLTHFIAGSAFKEPMASLNAPNLTTLTLKDYPGEFDLNPFSKIQYLSINNVMWPTTDGMVAPLDVSHMSDLIVLRLGNLPITKIDVSGNSMLVGISLESIDLQQLILFDYFGGNVTLDGEVLSEDELSALQ